MTALAGTAAALSAGLVAAVLLAAPGAAASVGAAARAAASTATTAGPTSTATAGTSTAGSTTAGPTTRPTSTSSSSMICPTYSSPPPWPNGVGPSWTFEDGTAGAWYAPAGSGVTLAVTSEAAASGTRSLRVDGLTPTTTARVAPSTLPSISWYRVTAKVRAAAGTPTAYATLTATPASADGRRPMTRRVTSDGWTTLVTYFRPDQRYPPGTCSGLGWVPAATEVTLSTSAVDCPDTPAGPVSLLVDDVAVTQYSNATAPPPTSTDQIPTCGPTSPTTPPTTPPATQCTATYQVVAQWPGGHQANLTVRNLTATTLQPWTLRIVFADGSQILSLWGTGTWTQSGNVITATGPAWNPGLPPGGTVIAGFVRSGTASPPTSVALDDMPCALTT